LRVYSVKRGETAENQVVEAEYELGGIGGELALRGLEAVKEHSCRMAGQSRRRLLVYSHGLDARIYGQPCFIEAARQLVIRHPTTRLEILVADTSELVQGGHRLLLLAQDLTSSIAIRRRNEEYEGDTRSFLLVDDRGYLLRNLWYDFDNVRADYSSRPVVQRLADEFRRIWDRSSVDPALRRLHL